VSIKLAVAQAMAWNRPTRASWFAIQDRLPRAISQLRITTKRAVGRRESCFAIIGFSREFACLYSEETIMTFSKLTDDEIRDTLYQTATKIEEVRQFVLCLADGFVHLPGNQEARVQMIESSLTIQARLSEELDTLHGTVSTGNFVADGRHSCDDDRNSAEG
jgi:hypothetical protein